MRKLSYSIVCLAFSLCTMGYLLAAQSMVSYSCNNLCLKVVSRQGQYLILEVLDRGEPLANSKVNVILNSRYAQALATDAWGRISISAPLALGANRLQVSNEGFSSELSLSYYSYLQDISYIPVGITLFWFISALGDFEVARGRLLIEHSRADYTALSKAIRERESANSLSYEKIAQSRVIKGLPVALSDLMLENPANIEIVEWARERYSTCGGLFFFKEIPEDAKRRICAAELYNRVLFYGEGNLGGRGNKKAVCFEEFRRRVEERRSGQGLYRLMLVDRYDLEIAGRAIFSTKNRGAAAGLLLLTQRVKVRLCTG